MSPPWMPFYPGDYLQDTRRLTPVQHGAYLLLIFEYWINGSLPDDDEQLARIIGMSSTEWRKTRPIIQSFFHDGWQHSRVDRELAKAKAKQELRQNAGKRGGIATANARANAAASSSQPEPQPKDTSSLRSEDAPEGAKAKRPAKERNRRTQLPELWQPAERDVIYAHERGFFAEKLQALASAFANYHRSKANLMADWHAAWRTWCDNEIKFHGGKNVGRKTVHDAAREQHERILAQIAAFDEPAPSCIRDGEIAPAVRLISSGRRE